MIETELAIVGAGLAGMTAARTAFDAGTRPLILEAGHRIGGRIEGLPDADGRVVGDLGPSWVWPAFQPGIQRWLDRLDLPVFDQYEHGDAVLDGFAPTPMRHQLPGQFGMARIVGGPSRLVEAMAAPLDAGCFHYGSPVESIRQRDDGRLEVHRQSGPPVIAGQVLVAAPPRRVAERITLPASIDPGLHRALAGQSTWMAAQAKAIIQYAHPFWRDAGLSGRIASRVGPLFEAHDHTSAEGDAALFGFISTPLSERRGRSLEQPIIDQLTRCLGPQAAQPEAVVIRDWAMDDTVCSEADRREPPAHPSVGPATLRAPHLGRRLWFCAAETADQSTGLLEGALLAGEAAARGALEQRPQVA
ncbi:FAD-dependent oxidoreductase [Spiribacter sp. 1M153]|uniref:flavin monoamine oxidase family protein n=1 Tax=Spiribacter roseus TaxID=1855875 RepID=UPI00349F9007